MRLSHLAGAFTGLTYSTYVCVSVRCEIGLVGVLLRRTQQTNCVAVKPSPAKACALFTALPCGVCLRPADGGRNTFRSKHLPGMTDTSPKGTEEVHTLLPIFRF